MSNDFIMSPKIDFAFKELMQDEQVRKGFLSAVLNIPLESITKTTLLETSLRKRTEEEKLGILDVRVLLNDETEIDIEIQVYYFKEWKKRSIYYWSKMFSDSLKEGEHYNKLKQCISISILDFTLINNEKDFFSCYQLCETTKHTIYTDIMKFYVIELPKLPKELKETNNVYLWSRFIASNRKEEMEMLASENKEIDIAYQRLQVISQDEQKKRDYEARQKAIRDTLSLTAQFREEGWEKGLEEGRTEGQKHINLLYLTLKQEGRIDDIFKCMEDAAYCKKLLKEYNIV